MEYKILNFPDAMRVAQIVTKYMPDTESIKEMTGDKVVSTLHELIGVDVYITLEALLLVGSNEVDPEVILTNCVTSMIKNNILDLLTCYRHIGFGE